MLSFRFSLVTDIFAVPLKVLAVGLLDDFHLRVSMPCRIYKTTGAYTESIGIGPKLT
jgi:hypothetical protein